MFKYIIVSMLSSLITYFFIGLYNYDKTQSVINNQLNKKSIIDDYGNYIDGQFDYKNWKIRVGDGLKNYQSGSTLTIANQQNPISLMITDNDQGEIESFYLVGKLINNNKHTLCDMDKIRLFFNKNNEINKLIIYDGDEITRKLDTAIVLQREIDGKWNIINRKIVECID